MSVLSNMFIMSIRKIIATVVLVFISSLQLKAQSPSIEDLKTTRIKPLITNVFVYGTGGRETHENLWTAVNSSLTNGKDTYGKYSDIGAGVEIYKENGWFQFNGSLGYKYLNYGYDKKFISDSGIDSHWLSTDLKAEVYYGGVGIKSDIFLHSRTRSTNNFDHNGIYPSCFNPMTLCWFFAMQAQFTRLKVEARCGTYIIPHINPSKIAYYNLSTTYVEGWYFEVKLSLRIFTTGSPFNAPIAIF